MMVKKSETYRANKNCRNGPLGKKIWVGLYKTQ